MKKYGIVVIVIFVVLLFVFSFVKVELPFKGAIPNNDKVHHIVAYFLFTILFLYQNWKLSLVKRVLFIFIIGLLIEFLQLLYGHGRQFSVYDLQANATGIAVGLLVYFTRKYFQHSRNYQ